MRVKSFFILLIGVTFLAVLFKPIYLMLREAATEKAVMDSYVVRHDAEKLKFSPEQQTSAIRVNDRHIEIIERNTGRRAPATPWDIEEGVPSGEIVEVQFVLDGKKITEQSEIWLSNRDRGGRYFSWIDVFTVLDRETGISHTAIVQRLTDDDTPMDDRQWRILHVYKDGIWEEESFGYLDRSEHPLGVRLVTLSNTGLMAMGCLLS